MEETGSIESALGYLTSASVRNFYATVINALERVPAKGFKTMAVAAHRGRYVLIYDPDWIQTISFEELLATVEHEVIHIILHHIPRYLRLRRLFEDTDDKELFKLCSNTASDLADNCLLMTNFPKIADPAKPLGNWILPNQFKPMLPNNLDYEKYHMLLTHLFRQRLTQPTSKLYQLAKKALEQQQQQLQQALQAAYPNKSPDGEGEESSKGQGEPQQGQGEPQQGQGSAQSQDSSGSGDASESVELDLNNLDPIDQLAVKLLMETMAKHMAWDAAADINKKTENQEADPHKLEEHGRQIVSEVVRNTKKTRGTVPANVAEIVKHMLAPPTVPWTQFLHNIVQQTRQTKKQRGMSRPSKKLAAFKVYAQKELTNDAD